MTDGRLRGSCYGFDVSSELPFRFLRDTGAAGSRLAVSVSSEQAEDGARGEFVLEWKNREVEGQDVQLYADGDRFLVHSNGIGWFGLDPAAGRLTVPDTSADIGREQVVLSAAMSVLFHARGDLPLHSSAVEVDGGAIVLAAPGTFGKTTTAAAFWRAGHRLLNEDLSCVRRGPEPAVLPGPAMIRLRRDVAEAIHLPDVETVIETPVRVCLALDRERRGDSTPVPIRAIVLMMPPEPQPRIERVDAATAVRDLWALCGMLPTEADAQERFAAAAELADTVPVYTLTRAQSYDDLDRTVEAVVARV